ATNEPHVSQILYQVVRRSILYRSGRVYRLELGEQPDVRVRAHARDLDERRVADGVEDVFVAAAMRRHARMRIRMQALAVVERLERPDRSRPAQRGHQAVNRLPWPAG